MENEQVTKLLQKLQAHQLALELAVRYLLLQNPALAEFLRTNAQSQLGEAMFWMPATDAQIQDAVQTLQSLAAVPPPSEKGKE